MECMPPSKPHSLVFSPDAVHVDVHSACLVHRLLLVSLAIDNLQDARPPLAHGLRPLPRKLLLAPAALEHLVRLARGLLHRERAYAREEVAEPAVVDVALELVVVKGI